MRMFLLARFVRSEQTGAIITDYANYKKILFSKLRADESPQGYANVFSTDPPSLFIRDEFQRQVGQPRMTKSPLIGKFFEYVII